MRMITLSNIHMEVVIRAGKAVPDLKYTVKR